jgi:predicted lipoprotein with Yx(FWY)xxD motif
MTRTIRSVAGLFAVAALGVLVACSTSSSPAASGPPPTDGVVNMASQATLGSYLTDSRGHALYLWVADTSGTSTCAGACAATWPPLTVTGTPKAGSGVDAAKLGTVARSDGTTQVTYDKHPLYVYTSDTKSGDLNGQGSTGFGAAWWLVSPDGSAITTTVDNGPPMGGY